uniref:Bestrophin homolog n=1 Tax=Octactis speculum TaxID=3111310 RepID=A0A7S2MNL7_9STRA
MRSRILVATSVALFIVLTPVIAFQQHMRTSRFPTQGGSTTAAHLDKNSFRALWSYPRFPTRHFPILNAALPAATSATLLPKPKLRYSSSDWLVNLRTILSSKILWRIRSHLAATTSVAILVALLRIIEVLPRNRPLLEGSPHSLLGGALSLMLVFRTNAAYDRWWEARKTLGLMRASSREAARCCGGFIHDHAHRVRIASLIAVFPELLRLQVTNRPRAAHTEGASNACTAAGVGAGDMESIMQAQHRALQCNCILGAAVKQAFNENKEYDCDGDGFNDPNIKKAQPLSLHASLQLSVERKLLEDQVQSLARCLGVCERIRAAPVPYSYSRHTSRFLSVWIATLPLVLPAPPAALPFLVAFVAWALLSIEEIGHIIEEPFNMPFTSTPGEPRTSLDMEVIADLIVIEVISMVPELAAVKCDRRDDQTCEALF